MRDLPAFPIQGTQQLADLIRGLRRDRGLTQKEVAALVGLQQKTVSLLETEPNRCSVDTLFKYLSAIRYSVNLKSKDDDPYQNCEW